MLIKLLPEDKKYLLVELAKLLSLSDNQLLWDGKTKDEMTSSTDFSNLTIQKNDLETQLLVEMEQCVSGYSSSNASVEEILWDNATEQQLIEKLKSCPLSKIDAPESRVQAATSVLRTLLGGKKVEDLFVQKIMVFQLFLVALRDGKISNIEWMLLEEVRNHYSLPDFIFKDLLERAEMLNDEVSKTLALILE